MDKNNLHPLTLKSIEATGLTGLTKYVLYCCGCEKRPGWYLCQYHQGYEDAARAQQERWIGYVVLTKQPDGSWKDDWDGEVHSDLAAAEAEFIKAGGREFAALALLTRIDGGEKPNG